MKYCICWEVAKAPAAHTRWESVIIFGNAGTQHLLFPCALVCVCVSAVRDCAREAVFQCGSVFDFSISHLSGWQFKTNEWNISEPFPKLQ